MKGLEKRDESLDPALRSPQVLAYWIPESTLWKKHLTWTITRWKQNHLALVLMGDCKEKPVSGKHHTVHPLLRAHTAVRHWGRSSKDTGLVVHAQTLALRKAEAEDHRFQVSLGGRVIMSWGVGWQWGDNRRTWWVWQCLLVNPSTWEAEAG